MNMKESFFPIYPARLVMVFACAVLNHLYFSNAQGAESSFQQEKTDRYLRWIIPLKKEKITVLKDGNQVVVETLDRNVYEQLLQEFKKRNLEKDYFKSLDEGHSNSAAQTGVYHFSLKFNNEYVEMFQFRREEDQSLVVDFWLNEESKASLQSSDFQKNKSHEVMEDWQSTNDESEKEKKIKLAKENELKKNKKDSEQQEVAKITENVRMFSESPLKKGMLRNTVGAYLDFRYGSSFLWPYEPLLPMIEKDLDLTAKTPEFLYPVEDRPKFKEEREAHLQLMINFFRKKNYGYMKKSMDLFEKKYKLRANESDLIKYLSALSIIQNQIKKPNPSLFASSISLLENLLQTTNNHDLKLSLYRYILQYKMNQKDFVGSLKLARDFFIFAQEKNLKSMIYISSKSIMYSLAMLGEVEKLTSFMNEPSVQDWLDGQEGIGFKYYSFAIRKEYSAIVNHFEKIDKGLTKPLYPSVLYHVAEAYFNIGEFDQALPLFRDFTKNYPFISEASFARIRTALIMDLLDYPIAQVTSAYQEAINLATLSKARYEAKLRYIGIAFNRKVTLAPKGSDKAILGFFEYQVDEEVNVKGTLKHLLWLTRLRSMIREKKYEFAMTYWQTLPLDDLDMSYREVFIKDGTEIVIGLLQESFTANDFAKVLKRWGMYQTTFGKYIGQSKDALYYISQSALKLNLTDIAEQYISQFSSVQEYNYPIWVERLHSSSDFDLLIFKNYLKKNNIEAANGVLPKLGKNSVLWNWAQAMLMFQEKKINEAKIFTESILISDKSSQLDKQDLVELLLNYFQSQEVSQWDDAVRNKILAVLQGLNIENQQFRKVIEMGQYLLTESYSTDPIKQFESIERNWNYFKTNFKNSGYIYRMTYIYGTALIKNNKIKKGKETLEVLIKDDKVPSYIREMAKNDLNSLTDSAKL